MKKTIIPIFSVLITLSSIALLICSILHKNQLDSQLYTQTVFIDVEFKLIILLILFNLINIINIYRFANENKHKPLILCVSAGACSLISIILSFIIDAPTLLYMT